MTALEEIETLYASIKEPLKRSPMELIDELDFRSQWLARSAELLADAQKVLDVKRGQESGRQVAMNTSPSLAKSIIDGNCAEEKRICFLVERLNATLTHQIDAIRSILSFEKESAKLAR